VDLDSNPTKLLDVVLVGKQLLVTRGALTTFSIANDVAKYFAILPALFIAAYPQLGVLNLMQLGSPESAILSAIIFNALIIVALVPLALRGQPAGLGRQPAAPQPADLRRRRPDSAFHRYQADRPGHHRPGTGVMKTPRDGIHGQIVHHTWHQADRPGHHRPGAGVTASPDAGQARIHPTFGAKS
jgi:hypothetical protein